jgi:hypothetical protein
MGVARLRTGPSELLLLQRGTRSRMLWLRGTEEGFQKQWTKLGYTSSGVPHLLNFKGRPSIVFFAGNGDLDIWDIAERKSVRRFGTNYGEHVGHSVSFTDRGTTYLLAYRYNFSGYRAMHLYSLDTGTELSRIPLHATSPIEEPTVIEREGNWYAVFSANHAAKQNEVFALAFGAPDPGEFESP